METRDSFSQVSTAAVVMNREVPPTNAGGGGGLVEEDINSMAAALAKDASLHFQTGRFDECLNVLHQLALKKEDDPKILNNIAIAEYFRDGCSNPKKLLEVLNKIKKKNDELATMSHEMIENTGSKGTAGAKGGGTMAILTSNNASHEYMDEYDSAVVSLNIAIVWFHLHDYSQALSVLLPLYQKIDPIDEAVALHVCLLLLDVALACQEASKSVEVLNYLEKASGSGCMGQSANSSAKPFAGAANAPVSDGSTDLANSGISLENSLSRSLSLSDDVLEDDDSMFLEMGAQHLGRPAGLPSCEISRTPIHKSLPTIDLKLKLQLYKVQFLLLTRNLKHAKREVKLALNIARGRDSSTALLLKSQLEYARGNHRKAIKLLLASTNRSEDGMGIMMNNLGCIYYRLGKYHLSSVLFGKALNHSASQRKEKSLNFFTSAEDKSFFIFYNSGMQHLVCGNPLIAARCFQKASAVLYNRPILWLRLAECCLMALEKGTIDRNSSELSDILVHVIGRGKYRCLAIGSGKLENDLKSSQGNDAKSTLSLSMARQFLCNSLYLLDSYDSKQPSPDLHSSVIMENSESIEGSLKSSNHKSLSSFDAKASTVSTSQLNSNGEMKEPKGASQQDVLLNSVMYYEEARRRDKHKIKQAILANLAYVELEQGNPLTALSRARSLLELQECSRIYRYFGHAYAAEALCMLKQPEKAAELLSTYLSGGVDIDMPFSEEDCDQWLAERPLDGEESNGVFATSRDEPPALVFQKPEEARGALYVNFAVINAMQGQLELAHHFATRALALLPHNRDVTLTAVYIDLVRGQSQSAISKLKHCKVARFLPCDLQ